MPYLSLSPVSVGLYAALDVAGLTALVGSRIYDGVPQAPVFPFVYYAVQEAREMRGFGTGGMPEVTFDVEVFSQYEGMKEAQTVMQKVIELLRDQPLTVSGYAQAGRVFYDATVASPIDMINGVKVSGVVSRFRTYMEEV